MNNPSANFVNAKVDSTTFAWQSIDHAHAEIHCGEHFYIENYATLGNDATLQVSLVTPNNAKWAHFIWNIQSSGDLITEFYENAAGITAGSDVTPINNNRNSTNLTGITIKSGVTAATFGTKISSAAWKSKTGGSTTREDEIILRQNRIYLRRFISGAVGNLVSFKASWYEHQNQ